MLIQETSLSILFLGGEGEAQNENSRGHRGWHWQLF